MKTLYINKLAEGDSIKNIIRLRPQYKDMRLIYLNHLDEVMIYMNGSSTKAYSGKPDNCKSYYISDVYVKGFISEYKFENEIAFIKTKDTRFVYVPTHSIFNGCRDEHDVPIDIINNISIDMITIDNSDIECYVIELNEEHDNANVVLLFSNLNLHMFDYNNPHKITKSTIGLSNVDNTSDADKPLSKAAIGKINTLAQKFLYNIKGYVNSLKEERDKVSEIIDDKIGNYLSDFKNDFEESYRSKLDVIGYLKEEKIVIEDLKKELSNTYKSKFLELDNKVIAKLREASDLIAKLTDSYNRTLESYERSVDDYNSKIQSYDTEIERINKRLRELSHFIQKK